MLYYIKKKWLFSSFVSFLQIFTWGLSAFVQILLIKLFGAAISLDLDNFIFWTTINFVFWALSLLMQFILDYFQSKLIRVLNNQVRHDICTYIFQKDHYQYHELDTGEYLSWLTNNIKQIEKMSWDPFFNIIGQCARIFWSLVSLATIDVFFLLFAVVSSLVMWFIPKIFEKKLEKIGENFSKTEAESTSKLRDLLSGFDTFCLFNRRNIFLKKADFVSDEIEKSKFNLSLNQNISGIVIDFFNIASQLASNFLVLFLSLNGRIKIESIAGISNLISGVTSGFKNVADFRLLLVASKNYFYFVDEIKAKNEEGKVRLISFDKSICFERLSFSYEKNYILKDVDLKFEKNKKYAIIGSSGYGKTTLLKILVGWVTQYSGNIYVDGINMRNIFVEDWLEKISYIEQDVFLFNTTIRENLTLDGNFSEDEIKKVLEEVSLLDDLNNMMEGIDTIVGEGGKNLSGGQKQKLAIARSLLQGRTIFLVDEGTSALDKKNSDIIENNLLKNSEITLILVSHHLSPERKMQFDKVYEFKKRGELC